LTAAELAAVVEAHGKWRRGEEGGSRAYLSDANLSRANLSDADLSRANLSPIRDDLYKVLASAPAEVPGLLLALREGRVDGSTYHGSCACLVGTLANVRGCSYGELGFEPDSSRPAERWFLAITEGSTPDKNPVAKITEGWIVDWLANGPAAKSADLATATAEASAAPTETL